MLELNFMPEKKQAIKLKLEYFYWGFEAIGLLVILMGINGIYSSRVNHYTKMREEKAREVKQNEALLKKIKKLTADRQNLQRKKNIIDRLDTNRQKWVKLLDNILDLMPNQIWLSNFSGKNNQIHINGVAITILYLNDFIKSLETSNMFTSVTLGKIVVGRTASINQPTYVFDLTLAIKAGAVSGVQR